MIPGTTRNDLQQLFPGNGTMAARMRATDWSSTPLGPVDGWPQGLRTAVRILLTSRYAMWMGWGPDLTFFYNDSYRPTLGIKDATALGASTRKVWAEIWPDIGPRVEHVLNTGEATWDEALMLFLERSGFPEETYHTFSYSPLADDAGAIAGMLCVVTEETDRVIGERRLSTLSALASDLAGTNSNEDVRNAIERRLGANANDLPFALVYRFGDDAARFCSVGFDVNGGSPAPDHLPLDDSAAFDLSPLLRGATRVEFDQLDTRLATVPCGAWPSPPRQAVAVPIARSGQERPAGALIVGVNPYRALDAAYGGFLDLLAGQIAAGLGNATAYEEERRRAEALAELDRAKTTFFSNVSHEFRTPLTLMLGPLEELQAAGSDQPPRQAELVDVAHRNGLRLLKLVNTLLDFARIEAGRVQARYQPTDLARFTTELASSFESALEKAGLTMTIDAPPLPDKLYVDRDMWEKVVLNLLSNAFKFTFNGGITVRVFARADGEAAVLEVEDTGTGIPPAEVPRLFERFHRVEGAQGRSYEGSGIGLALVQELVRLHGGTVTATSELGRGSKFRVEIPFGAAHLPADRLGNADSDWASSRAEAYVEEALRWLPGEDAHAPDAVPTRSSADDLASSETEEAVGHARIVLADDNADMRDYVRRILAGRGYEVEAVGDGEAALLAIQARKPDLVLSDVMMPVLNGFQLLRAVRADLATADVPVVLLSARAGEEATIEGLDAGADDYLVKPFSARELLARVSATLQAARVRREAQTTLRSQARTLETLNRVGTAVAAELDLDRAVQIVTDAATQLTGAEFGAFFYNVINDRGESYMLYTLSGVPREAFSSFPMPRNTAVFAPTFGGEGIVRLDDVTKDPRYGKSAPHHGMPQGHLPVRSYLASSVVSRSGEVLGGLFFGHSTPGMFTERHEQLLEGISAQAAIAIDNARLFQAAQDSERKLRDLNETLEQRIAARTEELATANRQLLTQIEERERVEATLTQMQRLEAVGQLTAGVAHDFNNLLTVITGSVEWLERRVADPAQTRRLELMRAASDRGATLTGQLLAFSRRQRLAPKPTDLNVVIAEMRGLLQSTIGGALAFQADLAPELWPALVDPTQIELVILNLAINARDAMPVGGALTVRTANVETTNMARRPEEPLPGQYVMVEVEDTGTGMSDAVLAKAFEPFFTTKEVGKGSGLGLAQVYGFAKQSGGGVRIVTAEGKGTSVQVYLPRAAIVAAEAPHVVDRAVAGDGGAGRTVLLVDDDDAVREVTSTMLRDAQYRVLTAGSGGAALDVLERTQNIDLLVLDFAMPGMNGAEVARRARAIRPDLPIIFVTGYAEIGALHAAGEAHVLQKPFRAEALTQTVRRALDSSARSAL
ncbi:response regulator [Roseiterribacter gracilis]|uniref:histidine kinase n=1 Tax=Roseiterribacter gracilis TaxID=2812848 RepID=A0A8S8X8D6_9PROT|nr:hypothetical protein TMPK1_03180 [Rhodospirillales bacterium TMPK1]